MLRRAHLILLVAFLALPALAQNALQFSAENYETDLGTKVTKARGAVKVEIGARRLEADSMELRPQDNLIVANGKIKITEGLLSIEGEEANVEMRSSRGNFRNAVLRYGTTLYVEGRNLEALGENRFRVTNGKVSFCMDCPQSWSVFGTSIELEIEGYAEIHHALFQIKDQPVAYFPVFYFPIKTKRQSGFLFPELAQSQDLGVQMGQSYFWAIAPDQDATMEYRYMTEGGHRLGTEYRYVYSDRSFVRTHGTYVRNMFVPNVGDDRFGFSMGQRWQVSDHWVQRFRGEMTSDTRYTSSFDSDFPNSRMPTLTNKFSLAWQKDLTLAYVQGFWNESNLIRDETKGVPSQGALQAEPHFRFVVPSFKLLGPLRFQNNFEHTRFRRKGAALDPVTGWIREGDRTSLVSRGFLPLYLGDVALLESSVEARVDLYKFDVVGVDPTAARGRLALEEKLSGQLYRVYSFEFGELKAIKHTWEPSVSWGYSPNDALSLHPFFSQTAVNPGTGARIISPKFDIYDPSIDAALAQLTGSGLEARLRPHHLVSWGLGTRLVGRFEREGNKVYEDMMGVNVSQDYDLRSNLAQRLNILGFGAHNGLRVQSEIALDVNTGAASVRNEISLARASVDLSLVQSIREGLEQYGGSTRIKVFNPWSFAYAGSYDALSKRFSEQKYQVRYDSNASKCWFFTLDVDSRPNPDRPDSYLVRYRPNIGLVINEAGVSF